ncbi:MAG TPA: adenine phosphoribosyltransferase [Acidimicrobiales bacterium]|jgi:adenine phosphoribosyltransferase|nr:adenine phosphoribosyltransferase [Acidimicrobiales bacterium]
MGDAGSLGDHIRAVADFPRPGIVFRDITPLLAEPTVFRTVIDALVDQVGDRKVDKVVAIEARGFIIAAPLAYRLGAGFVPVRKAGKLPRPVEREEYSLEYGSDCLEIHADAVAPGESVLIVDDVLATGGTAAATVALVEKLGASVVGLSFVIELDALQGRGRLPGRDAHSLLHYTS